jgi:hypothetical protein
MPYLQYFCVSIATNNFPLFGGLLVHSKVELVGVFTLACSMMLCNRRQTGANPTIASYNSSAVNFYNASAVNFYNASAVNFYDATGSLTRFENKNYFILL